MNAARLKEIREYSERKRREDGMFRPVNSCHVKVAELLAYVDKLRDERKKLKKKVKELEQAAMV